jgi:hypothetical protein
MTVLTAEGAATESGQPHRITVEGDGQRVGLVQPVGKAGQADAL